MNAADDKARALAHYVPMAAAASLLPATWPGLTGGQLRTPEQRRINPRQVVTVQHKGIVWTVYLDGDEEEGWWIEAVQIDGQWVDAFEVFCPAFLDDLEEAHRSATE